MPQTKVIKIKPKMILNPNISLSSKNVSQYVTSQTTFNGFNPDGFQKL